jgi:hypothetical protein
MEARSSSAAPLEGRRRFEVRRMSPLSCGLEEGTGASGDDAPGTGALPPRPLAPSTVGSSLLRIDLKSY